MLPWPHPPWKLLQNPWKSLLLLPLTPLLRMPLLLTRPPLQTLPLTPLQKPPRLLKMPPRLLPTLLLAKLPSNHAPQGAGSPLPCLA